jgi:putative hydrolase of the HAD superfamily
VSGKQRFRFLLCDLDNTLYPSRSGVMQMVGQLIARYMVERVGISPENVEPLKHQYYQGYGSTMRGLIMHHGIDPEDYLAFVHDLPLEQYIQPNPDLDAMLASIPLRKVIFTNADREHAERVLAILDVRHHFERIIDVRDFGLHSKPDRIAYSHILDTLSARPDECILVEDAVHNLAPAKAMGMLTVLVEDGSLPPDSSQQEFHIRIEDILQLAEIIRPWLTG